MKPLSGDAMQKLDQMIFALEPVIAYLNKQISDKSISGQIDIQRISRLTTAYQEFMIASQE